MSDQAQIMMIFGRRGMGKTNRARQLVRQFDRVVIVDRKRCDYTDGIVFDKLDELKAFWNSVVNKSFRLIYRPAVFDDDLIKDDIDKLADWAMKCGNMALLIEELNVIYNYQRFSNKLNELVFAGRQIAGKSRGVDLITVSQRPKGFGQNIISQAGIMQVFGSHHADDLKHFKDCMGDEVVDTIKSLKPLQYLEWDFNKTGDDKMKVLQDEYRPA